MSQHNIVGSEAFQRAPSVHIRNVRTGSFRRRRSRVVVGFIAGAVIALGGAGAVLAYAISNGLV